MLPGPAEKSDPVRLERAGARGFGVEVDLPPADAADMLSRTGPAHRLEPPGLPAGKPTPQLLGLPWTRRVRSGHDRGLAV